jgi:hypothetical protein
MLSLNLLHQIYLAPALAVTTPIPVAEPLDNNSGALYESYAVKFVAAGPPEPVD